VIEQNILQFITTANLTGLNAVNRALQQQTQRLRELAAAARTNRAGQIVDPSSRKFLSQAEYQRQIAQATSFKNRINDIYAQVGANLKQALQRALVSPQALAASFAGLGGRIVAAMGLAGIGAALLNATRGAATGMARLFVQAAQTAGAAITRYIGGALRGTLGLAQRVAGVIGGIGRRIAGLGAIASLGVIVGTKAATAVDKQLAVINTIARTTQDGLDQIAFGLENIASSTGTTFGDLSQGFYDLLSAGLGFRDGVLDINQSLTLMQDAANLAVGGLGSVSDSIDFLTTLLNSFRGPLTKEFGDPLKASTVVVDAFAKAVEIGKVTVAQLAPVFSNVAPLAAQLGLDFRETAAVVAVMTQQGFSAGKSFTALRSALVGTQRGAKLLQKALKDPLVGSELAKVGAEGWLDYLDIAGFQKFAILLRSYSERSGVPLIKLLGRIEGVQAILGTTGSQAANYVDALNQITNASGNAAEQAELLNDSLSAQLGLLGQALFATGDRLFRRSIVNPLKEVVKQIRLVITAFNDWLQKNQAIVKMVVPILSVLAAIAGLTAGAAALETIFFRLGGPISGFAIGIVGIARAIAILLGPLALAWAAFNFLSKGVASGILPAKTFVPLLEEINYLLGNIGKIGADAAAAIGGVFEAITRVDVQPGDIAHGISQLLKDVAANLETDLSSASNSIKRTIGDLAEIIFGEFGPALATRAKEAAPVILKALGDALAYVFPRLISTLGQLFTFGSEVVTNLVNFGARILAHIGEGFAGALESVADWINGIPAAFEKASSDGGFINAMAKQGAQWWNSIIGWFADNGPEILRGVQHVLEGIAGAFAKAAPKAFDAAVKAISDVGPQIIAGIGDAIPKVVAALGDLAGKIVPPLAEATGKLIDWVAAALPGVLSAIAGWIDSVVKALVPLGDDNGQLGDAMGDAGGQLVKWIGDRVGPALSALLDWALAIENWIITVFAPRLGAVLLAAGVTLVKALVDGLISALTHLDTALPKLAEIIGGLLAAGVILNAARLAGIAVQGAWMIAIWSARNAATLLATGTRALIGLVARLFAPTAAAGAAAGGAVTAAFLAAVAIPIAAVIYVAVTVISDIQKQEEALRQQVSDFVTSGTTQGLEDALARLKADYPEHGGLEGFLFGPGGMNPAEAWARSSVNNAEAAIEAELARRKGLQLVLDVYTNLNFHLTPEEVAADLREATAILGVSKGTTSPFYIQDDVDKFTQGVDSVVASFNSLPDRLKTAADLVTEALNKPFDLDQTLADFKTNYELILQAQASGNVNAIVNANGLKTTMVTAAEEINAAFVAAGKAPPLLINAITGQITPATNATNSLVTGITTPVGKLPSTFTTAGGSAKNVVTGINGQKVPAANAAGSLVTGVAGEMNPNAKGFPYNFRVFGFNIGNAWTKGVISAVASKTASDLLDSAVRAFTNIMFGASPPKEGPLKEIDVWGFNVGNAWVDGVVSSLENGASRVANAMAGIGSVMGAGVDGPTVRLAYASGEGTVAVGALGGGAGAGAGTSTARMEDLLGRVGAKLDLHSQILSRIASRDPEAGGPLASRGTLDELRILAKGA
jgi:TP901 family phage tail tape measure protein